LRVQEGARTNYAGTEVAREEVGVHLVRHDGEPNEDRAEHPDLREADREAARCRRIAGTPVC